MKTTLKQLAELFKDYASSDENPQSIRQFAAQLAILTAHVGRVEFESRKAQKAVDAQIAELAQHILKLRQGTPESPDAQAQPSPSQPTQTRPAQAQQQPQQAVAEQADEEDGGEEDDIESMIKKVQADNAAEAASVIAKHQKPNGQAEAQS